VEFGDRRSRQAEERSSMITLPTVTPNFHLTVTSICRQVRSSKPPHRPLHLILSHRGGVISVERQIAASDGRGMEKAQSNAIKSKFIYLWLGVRPNNHGPGCWNSGCDLRDWTRITHRRCCLANDPTEYARPLVRTLIKRKSEFRRLKMTSDIALEDEALFV
jgi:hypothetical protein